MRINALNTIWKSRSMKWKVAFMAGLLGLLIFMLFIFSIGFSPLNRMKEYARLAESDTLMVKEYLPIYDHPDLQGVVREKAFNEALLELSKGDSIQLVVNLADSAVNLYLKGVKIHETRLDRFRIDDFMFKLPNNQYVKIFSRPLLVHSQYATIVKEPIVVREAPKDPEEAALNAWQPDTLIQNPAFLQLSLEQGINLVFEQDQNRGLHNQWVRFIFRSRMRAANLLSYSGHFFTLKKLEYNPSVTIRVPANDLRAIYRALPGNAEVVIVFR